jgi:hypothetical protein
MKTPQIPAMAGMTPLGVKPENESQKYAKQWEQRHDLLAAAQRMEAESHWSNDVYGYVVSKGAMDNLCSVIGKVKK